MTPVTNGIVKSYSSIEYISEAATFVYSTIIVLHSKYTEPTINNCSTFTN
jgi:hypothetical protein